MADAACLGILFFFAFSDRRSDIYCIPIVLNPPHFMTARNVGIFGLFLCNSRTALHSFPDEFCRQSIPLFRRLLSGISNFNEKVFETVIKFQSIQSLLLTEVEVGLQRLQRLISVRIMLERTMGGLAQH